MTELPSSPGLGPAVPADTLPSPLEAIGDLRSAARWTIAAAGAVGVAVIGGGPLVAVGKVHGLEHAVIAAISMLVGLAGVGLAIWQTSLVLVPPVTTAATLREESIDGLREMIEAAPSDYFGLAATGIDDLLRHREIAANLYRKLTAEQDPAARAKLLEYLDRAQANLRRTDPYVRWLLATAHVWRIQAALRRARWYTLVGALLVAVGTVGFLSVTGQQGTTYVPVLTPQITTPPPAQHGR
jgi:hypothetical protein